MLVVLLQVPDLSSEVSTFVVGSFPTQPITLEIMRIPMIEHVFIMPESFRGRLSSVNCSALASTLSLWSMENERLWLATHCGVVLAPMPGKVREGSHRGGTASSSDKETKRHVRRWWPETSRRVRGRRAPPSGPRSSLRGSARTVGRG